MKHYEVAGKTVVHSLDIVDQCLAEVKCGLRLLFLLM